MGIEKYFQVAFTDIQGEEIILRQNIQEHSIDVISRAKQDIDVPFTEFIPQGTFTIEFHIEGSKKTPLLDKQELIQWYNEAYRPYKDELDAKLKDVFADGKDCGF